MSSTSPASALKKTGETLSQKVSQQGAAAKRKAKQASENIANRAEHLADDVVETGRMKAQAYADTGISRTEEVIRSVGRAIEAGSRSLEDDGMGRTASYVRAAANGLNRAAEEVDSVDTGNLTHRVENFVRAKPMLTVGVLALAGFALAGALKRGDK